ncbi:chemotaxis protein CheW [Gammaproteobacteria bacterium AB-CW1]|uniref:Chemotaxis protein CheW n=1 Tax=Natronospira elongata TaxID=3110268 RepID=A0AAP6JD56_9GAMM|nr:chemotaxis protein CheW [Gammaproteobacteria bacterium AB-CW1]
MTEQDGWEQSDHSVLAGFEDDGRQVLSFSLGGEEYGIDIVRVQEIRGWSRVRKVPGAPEWMLGMLKLRGAVIPVVDMRLRFGLPVTESSDRTVIIILNLDEDEDGHDVGIVVDEVADVIGVPEDGIRPVPRMGTAVDTEYLEGIATSGEGMLMLLDADRLFRDWELKELREWGE